MDNKKEAYISLGSLIIDDSQIFKIKSLHEKTISLDLTEKETLLLDLTEKITKYENREWR